ncbi:NACHT domain-containing protein [Planktothrix mougeotii]|uniref:NACHT domain-containing NTPase n=1 Tax=Planktothrix mougeotii LEGE 06226 TaxID=1828728 RepID=A0ABR9UEC1_9CYAN|nr:NACHT domain-containing NTPase [Planktothrix mougeotii]MBE9144778.1 NACHT domain-containing NTPase [Planktothrix mougeotii LEGE 06226]
MSLPREFLIEMARKYELSAEQEDAFVIWFNNKKTELEIATELHISDTALRTRMSHVYKKFSINGKGPGKYGRLLNFLTTEYQKFKVSDPQTSNLSEDELNDLVQEVRQKCYEIIQDQCGTMRSLTMSQPIDVRDLYTNVNILEKITSHRRHEIDELLQDFNSKNFDRFGLGRVTDERIPGQEAVKKYSKLMVLGKPGSGKTTFLKHLAIQCNLGNFQEHCVSIFITLKQFAEVEEKPSLLEYITEIFADCDISSEQIAVLLKRGKLLILLDGLDEVKAEDNSRVIKQVLDLSEKFRRNQFLITCRIAAKAYNFDKFTEVEVADFDKKQINTFVGKWFNGEESAITEQFIEQLEQNRRIQELATNPLLLTLLCLVFEDSLKFPANRSELYEEGIDILLKKWDETRNIERDQVYKNLSLQRKKDLLSQIALTTFERGEYFFKQKELEQYISDYINNLHDAQKDLEALQLDSEAILKSIEAQHGLLVERAQKIYSFSHLTFQEYLTSIKIVKFSEEKTLRNLFDHITDKRWREIFLLTAQMLQNADLLVILMKQKIDHILSSEIELQHFLKWVDKKTRLANSKYKDASVKALYLAFFQDLEKNPEDHLFLKIDSQFSFDFQALYDLCYGFFSRPDIMAYEFAMFLLINKFTNGYFNPQLTSIRLLNKFYQSPNLDYYYLHSCFSNKIYFKATISSYFNSDVLAILPPIEYYLAKDASSTEQCYRWQYLDEWWRVNNQDWTAQFRSMKINYLNMGCDWQFRDDQRKLLQQYYDANKLLVDCLNGCCVVSPEVRNEIEQTLLLPISEIHPK